MQRRRALPRSWATAPAALLLACVCSCSPSVGDADQTGSTAAAASSAAAALSSAAQAPPGAYGTPVNPSLPNPTDVAVDPTPAPANRPSVSAPSASSAAVVVTYSGWVDQSSSVEVGAYVAGVVESGGTCTLTMSGPGTTRTVSVTAEADAGTTSCPTMAVPGAQLSDGPWTAVVGYRSADLNGTSSPVTVAVP